MSSEVTIQIKINKDDINIKIMRNGDQQPVAQAAVQAEKPKAVVTPVDKKVSKENKTDVNLVNNDKKKGQNVAKVELNGKRKQ